VRRALGLALAFGVGTAHADDAKRAKQLFEDGRKKIAAKQIDAACEAFAESLALDPEIGTRLNLASCREQQGRLREARELYDQSASEAARTGKSARADFARQQLHALEARAVRVRVEVTNPAGTKVTLGGAVIDPAQLQVVMPGTIVVEVAAEGKQPFRVEKSAAAGAELTIDVPALEPIGATPVTPVTRPVQAPGPVVVVHEEPARSHAYLYVGAAGVVLAGAGVGVLVHGKSSYDTAFKAGDRAGVQSAQREADIATALAIASGVTVAIAVVLYVRGRPAIAPIVSSNSVGLAIGAPW
jgi:tetratricopeptide (TPR) repeat protein